MQRSPTVEANPGVNLISYDLPTVPAMKIKNKFGSLIALSAGLLLINSVHPQVPVKPPATSPVMGAPPHVSSPAQYPSLQTIFSPVISSVTSAAGPIASALPGTIIQIHGHGFGATQGFNSVRLSNPAGTASGLVLAPSPGAAAWSDTLITLPVPALWGAIPGGGGLAYGNYALQVVTWNGVRPTPFGGKDESLTFASNGFAFAVLQPAPQIIALYEGASALPNGGYQASPGAEIGIRGTTFIDFRGCGPRGIIALKGALFSSNYRYAMGQADPVPGAEDLVMGLPAAIQPGTYSLYLVDGSGNQSNAVTLTISGSATQSTIIENAPTILSISPNPAWIQPPARITIAGRGFGNAQGQGQVTFSGASGTLSSFPIRSVLLWVDSEIQFQPPATLPAGPYHVGVYGDPVAACGKGSNGVDVTLLPGHVNSVSPSVAAVPMLGSPGTTVTVSGGGFVHGSTVSFGMDNPIPPTSISADGTTLIANLPPTAASGPVTVTLPSGIALTGPVLAVDNYRNTRGFSWYNTTGPGSFQQMVGSTYSYSDATAVFGGGQTFPSFDNGFGLMVLAFLGIADLSFDSAGQCFGMSQASLLFASGAFNYNSMPLQPAGSEPNGPPSPNIWMLNGPTLGSGSNVSPSLSSFVHRRMLAQYSAESIAYWVGFHITVTTAAALRTALQQAFTAGGANGMGAIIALDPSLGDGHAVVAYGIADTGNGGFNILIYNPDQPFEPSEDINPSGRALNASSSVISVSGNGHWTLSNPAMNGGIFSITVFPWNAIPVQPTLPGISTLASVTWSLASGDAVVTQVSDGQGHTLLANGRWNTDPRTTLTGMRPMPNFGGQRIRTPPSFVGIRSGPLTHTLAGVANGTYQLQWLGNHSGVTLLNVPTAPGAQDTAMVDAGKINFIADRNKTLTMSVLATSSQTRLPRVATLTTQASAGAALNFFYDPAADTFNYAHAGSKATYSIEFHSFDAQGKAISTTLSPATIDNGTTHTFAPDWTRLSTKAGSLSVHTPDGRVVVLPLQ
jgi:hypothetical protein